MVEETKDQTLTQAIHQIQKGIVHSDMSEGLEFITLFSSKN
jgi:hypothetical protein